MQSILFLEDDIALGEVYEKRFKREKILFTWVKSSNDLKKQLLSNSFNIVILDNSLKQDAYSGIELIPAVKKYAPAAKCIILSNYSQFQLEQEALQAGADEYLLKVNYSPKKLIEHLGNI